MAKRSSGEGSWAEVTIKGKKYHRYKISIEGKEKYFYGKTKKEALDKYKKYQGAPKVETESRASTFYEYAHAWLFNYKKDKIRVRTFDYYDFIIEGFIKDTTLGNSTIKKLNMLSQKESHKLFDGHLHQYTNKSKSTLDGIYTVLNQVCKYGVTYQDFSRNFMASVDKVSEKEVGTKKKEITALEYADVMKLWDEMLRKNEPYNIINNKAGTYVYGIGAYALLFCCFTGLRWGEVSSLRWQDIQEQDGHYFFKVDKQYITVKDRDEDSEGKFKTIISDPKSEKSNRYIPLSSKAYEILELVRERFPKCYRPDHLIFSTTSNPYTASVANRLLKTMCVRADVPVVSPHALRHSFASILLNEDEKNLYAVSDLLGHSSTDVTYKKYIDIFEKNKINAVSLFDNIKTQ
jgi:integrase